MKIRFENYGVETLDDYQVVLCEYKTIQDRDSPNYGKERKVYLGYYDDTGLALKALSELMVRRSEAQTMSDLLRDFEAFKHAISQLSEQCRKK